MILADTDILSALAKINRLPLLFELLRLDRLYLAPAVLGELAHSLNLGRPYAVEIFDLVSAGRLCPVSPTQAEAAFGSTLPLTLGAGERESIAIAKGRDGVVLSNESRVAHYCRQHEVPCLRLPDILRALWQEGILSKQDVRKIVNDLRTQDRMQFKRSTLEAIFSD